MVKWGREGGGTCLVYIVRGVKMTGFLLQGENMGSAHCLGGKKDMFV